MIRAFTSAFILSALFAPAVAHAADAHQHATTATPMEAAVTVELHLLTAEGLGDALGTVGLTDTPYGLLLTPNLSQLEAGFHGFHIHENGSCNPAEKDGVMVAGLAAGGHFDPTETGKHEGPYGEGHLGDLPPLVVDSEGHASLPILAPRLKVADVKGKALMVHVDGDNYSDEPKKLGGGGARKACGVIPE